MSYGIVSVDGTAARRTQTGTANPVWNERVTIPQVEHLDAKLVVTVCNKRAMGRCVYILGIYYLGFVSWLAALRGRGGGGGGY